MPKDGGDFGCVKLGVGGGGGVRWTRSFVAILAASFRPL